MLQCIWPIFAGFFYQVYRTSLACSFDWLYLTLQFPVLARFIIVAFCIEQDLLSPKTMNSYIYLGRGVVNLHASHHYSSLPALNAVIQAEYSHYTRETRSSSSSSEPMASPATSQTPQSELSPRDLWLSPRNHQHRASERSDRSDQQYAYHYNREQHSMRESSTRDSTPKDFEESWELREIIPKHSRNCVESKTLRDSLDQEDAVFIHERESSVSSTVSHTSQRSSNTHPHQNKSSCSTSSDYRYTVIKYFYSYLLTMTL